MYPLALNGRKLGLAIAQYRRKIPTAPVPPITGPQIFQSILSFFSETAVWQVWPVHPASQSHAAIPNLPTHCPFALQKFSGHKKACFAIAN